MSAPTPAYDVAMFLASAGLGLVVGTNVFYGLELSPPKNPAQAVFCLSYDGRSPEPYLGDTYSRWEYRVQVLVRRPMGDHAAGLILARNALRAIHLATVTNSSASAPYSGVYAMQSEPTRLPPSNTEFERFVFNVRLLVL